MNRSPGHSTARVSHGMTVYVLGTWILGSGLLRYVVMSGICIPEPGDYPGGSKLPPNCKYLAYPCTLTILHREPPRVICVGTCKENDKRVILNFKTTMRRHFSRIRLALQNQRRGPAGLPFQIYQSPAGCKCFCP
jgi:hypothetical protein